MAKGINIKVSPCTLVAATISNDPVPGDPDRVIRPEAGVDMPITVTPTAVTVVALATVNCTLT